VAMGTLGGPFAGSRADGIRVGLLSGTLEGIKARGTVINADCACGTRLLSLFFDRRRCGFLRDSFLEGSAGQKTPVASDRD